VNSKNSRRHLASTFSRRPANPAGIHPQWALTTSTLPSATSFMACRPAGPLQILLAYATFAREDGRLVTMTSVPTAPAPGIGKVISSPVAMRLKKTGGQENVGPVRDDAGNCVLLPICHREFLGRKDGGCAMRRPA
jgi:hypothetical protein